MTLPKVVEGALPRRGDGGRGTISFWAQWPKEPTSQAKTPYDRPVIDPMRVEDPHIRMITVSNLSVAWKKSSRSYGNGACVEVRLHSGQIQVRDSKNIDGPALAFHSANWQQFIRMIKEARLETPE
jgi:hypothetical protein